MRGDNGGEFWHILGGAIVGVLSQAISDAVTSVVKGELSISHWSNYVGAAVGGAVGAATSNPVVAGAVSAAISTSVGMVVENVETLVTGKGETHSFDEMFYETANSAMIGAALGCIGMSSNNTVGLDELAGKNFAPTVKQVLREVVYSYPASFTDGIRRIIEENWIGTHWWD